MDQKMLGPLRRVMTEFIRADSRQIMLMRPNIERTSSGGIKKASWTMLEEQTFRLVPYKRRLTDLVKIVADGEIPNIQYALTGFWNADIQRWDEFTLDGAYYRVQGLEPHTAVEEITDRKVAQLLVLDKAGVEWDDEAQP